MMKLLLIALLLAAGSVTALGQTQSQLARKLFSGTGVPTLNCTPGPIWRDVYIRTTTGVWYQCTAAPNTWAEIAGGGGSGAPTDATYITQTANGSLSAEQALSALSSGIMRVATTTGVITSLTNSAGIAANLSDETGSGALVFGTSPAITTPTGIVKGDVGLANVDNTSDAAKPVSTATQTALDLKAGLGDANSFTTGQLIQPTTDVAALTLRRNDIAHSSASLSIQEEDNDVIASISKTGNILGVNYTSTGQTYCINTACTVFIKAGTGAPESVVTGGIGSIWMRTDGSTDTSIYRKESGTGNTGWVAVAAGGGIGGTVGTTADAIVLANGTGGATAKGGTVTINGSSQMQTTVSSDDNGLLVFSATGAASAFYSGSGLRIGSAYGTRWSSSVNSYDTPDTGIFRQSASVLEINNGTAGQSGVLLLRGRTFTNLPATPVAGMHATVTDSSTATWGATITGGGANVVHAFYNGTNWVVD